MNHWVSGLTPALTRWLTSRLCPADAPSKLTSTAEPPLTEVAPCVLRFAHVRLARAGATLVHDACFELRQGEIAVLSGPRGGGKSSLLAAAAGALKPAEGEVWLGGRNMLALQRSSLPYVRRNIGYLQADAPLINDATALENVLVAPEARGTEPALARLQATDLLRHLGLLDALSRKAARLSSAGRRLVALARALCGPPALLLLDDPTTGLDPADRQTVLTALLGARAVGAAALVTSTDEAFASALASQGARRLRVEDARVTAVPSLALVASAAPWPHASDLRARNGHL